MTMSDRSRARPIVSVSRSMLSPTTALK